MFNARFLLEGIDAAEAEGNEAAPSTPMTENSQPSCSRVPTPDFSLAEEPCLKNLSLSEEALSYYAGLPSCPPLIGRSTTDWPEEPFDEKGRRKLKVLGTVYGHAINDLWEQSLSRKVVERLHSLNVDWTSIDVVRIGYEGEMFHPVILWIGVQPQTLSVHAGDEVADGCLEILTESGIKGVKVELRESRVSPLKRHRPKLLTPTVENDPTSAFRTRLSACLGLPISTKRNSWAEGTGGFYLSEGGKSQTLFLVTARHAVIQEKEKQHKMFEYKSISAPRDEVILLGDDAYEKLCESIKQEIEGKEIIRKDLRKRAARAEGGAGDGNEDGNRIWADKIDEVERAKSILEGFNKQVKSRWAKPIDRVLGHIIYSPPIELGSGPEKWTQDFAVIKIDPDMIDAKNFMGNVIDLGTKYSPDVLMKMMYPNPKNGHSFTHPDDRLLWLFGSIPMKDMRHPPDIDQDDEACLMVVKDGNTTGLTIGRANGVRSLQRNYKDGPTGYSLEWTIVSYDTMSGPFSRPGDSGAVVADGRGRIGGIITGGSGVTDENDVTYATSIHFLMKRIKTKFPRAHLHPELQGQKWTGPNITRFATDI